MVPLILDYAETKHRLDSDVTLEEHNKQMGSDFTIHADRFTKKIYGVAKVPTINIRYHNFIKEISQAEAFVQSDMHNNALHVSMYELSVKCPYE